MDIKPTNQEKEIVKKHQKEIKEIINQVNLWNMTREEVGLIWGTSVRALIIYILTKYEKVTKMQIHKFLLAIGEKIAYANTVWNLDKLEKEGLLEYKKEKRYNTTVVSLNLKSYEAYIKRGLKNFASLPRQALKDLTKAYNYGKKLK